LTKLLTINRYRFNWQSFWQLIVIDLIDKASDNHYRFNWQSLWTFRSPRLRPSDAAVRPRGPELSVNPPPPRVNYKTRIKQVIFLQNGIVDYSEICSCVRRDALRCAPRYRTINLLRRKKCVSVFLSNTSRYVKEHCFVWRFPCCVHCSSGDSAGNNTTECRALVECYWQGKTYWNVSFIHFIYEGWNFNSGNYLFTTDTK